MTEMYNTKNAGVRRLMQEAKELRNPTEMYHAQPMEDNLFEWHFTIRGTIETDFEGGIYHGRIIFPADYPMKPPNLILLTPNGRFELNKKICLSISGYHPETWLPSWSIRTALLALIGFLPSTPGGALGSLDYPPKERKRLAKLSGSWTCKECGCCMKDVLLPITEDGQSKDTEEAKKLAAQLKFQDESVVKAEVAEAEAAKSATHEASALVEDEASVDQNSTEPFHVPETSTDAPPAEFSPVGVVEDIAEPVFDIPNPAVREPIIREPSPVPLFQEPTRRLASRSFDYSLLVKIPLALICIAVFIALLARRILVENGNSLGDGSEL